MLTFLQYYGFQTYGAGGPGMSDLEEQLLQSYWDQMEAAWVIAKPEIIAVLKPITDKEPEIGADAVVWVEQYAKSCNTVAPEWLVIAEQIAPWQSELSAVTSSYYECKPEIIDATESFLTALQRYNGLLTAMWARC
jgi:hypothetical protein